MRQKIDENGYRTGVFTPGASQTVAYTGTSAASSAFAETTEAVTLIATTACFVVFGETPTATTAGHYLDAGERATFAVTGGHKVAAIQASAGGNLHVTELK